MTTTETTTTLKECKKVLTSSALFPELMGFPASNIQCRWCSLDDNLPNVQDDPERDDDWIVNDKSGVHISVDWGGSAKACDFARGYKLSTSYKVGDESSYNANDESSYKAEGESSYNAESSYYMRGESSLKAEAQSNYMRGYEVGFSNGFQKGYESGEGNGYHKGHEVGYQKAEGDSSNTRGYKDEDEYRRGYDDGYKQAVDDLNVRSATAAEPSSATTDSVNSWSKPDGAESAKVDHEVSPFQAMSSAPSKLQLRAPPARAGK